MRLPAGLLGAAALATVAAGCGTPGPDASVRGTIDAFLLNCGRGDGPAAQEVLATPARAAFEAEGGPKAGCARILGVDERDLGTPRVRAVRVSSDLAEADVDTGAGPRTVSLSFGRESWLIEGPH